MVRTRLMGLLMGVRMFEAARRVVLASFPADLPDRAEAASLRADLQHAAPALMKGLSLV
jgi:hypothetical protein